MVFQITSASGDLAWSNSVVLLGWFGLIALAMWINYKLAIAEPEDNNEWREDQHNHVEPL